MKRHFYLLLLLVLILLGCENNSEDIYRYAKVISQSKEYPVYLDMSQIGNVQVTVQVPQAAPFKIVSNDKYYFVGDMLKGIHVYEKKGAGTSYLCFVECKYIKDFEIVDNYLFCNNLVDLVILDVSNPLQIKILHRQTNYFNRFTGYKKSWNVPYDEGKGLIAGTEKHVLTGTVTDEKPNLDFTEYDQIYGNLTTKVIPDSWFSDHPENDRPYIGIIKVGTNEIYAYGTYNSWAICTFNWGNFSAREENLWTVPSGKFSPPYYYSDAYPVRMFLQDDNILILGAGSGNTGYCDCMVCLGSFHLYFPGFKPLDITYLPAMQAFFVLSGKSVWGVFKKSYPAQNSIDKYLDYKISNDATSIFRKGNNVITLGNKLSVYLPSENELKLVKDYPDISGTCYSISGDVLAVASAQGLFLYDINDLENIKLIP